MEGAVDLLVYYGGHDLSLLCRVTCAHERRRGRLNVVNDSNTGHGDGVGLQGRLGGGGELKTKICGHWCMPDVQLSPTFKRGAPSNCTGPQWPALNSSCID